jgi:hypothetical protein
MKEEIIKLIISSVITSVITSVISGVSSPSSRKLEITSDSIEIRQIRDRFVISLDNMTSDGREFTIDVDEKVTTITTGNYKKPELEFSICGKRKVKYVYVINVKLIMLFRRRKERDKKKSKR